MGKKKKKVIFVQQCTKIELYTMGFVQINAALKAVGFILKKKEVSGKPRKTFRQLLSYKPPTTLTSDVDSCLSVVCYSTKPSVS